MKTIKDFLDSSQLIKNIVKSELKHGREVFLVQNLRTKNTLLTSQPLFFGGEFVKGSIGLICGNEDGMGDDKLSTPLDVISLDYLENIKFKEEV